MGKIEELIHNMKRNPADVRFNDLCKVCDFYFKEARQKKSSHMIYKTPWRSDPRVNIQNDKGNAKVYQVKQVLKAIERLKLNYDVKE
ncbi:MAG: toxin HicA [Candidatus Anammoxibacter sp.]